MKNLILISALAALATTTQTWAKEKRSPANLIAKYAERKIAGSASGCDVTLPYRIQQIEDWEGGSRLYLKMEPTKQGTIVTLSHSKVSHLQMLATARTALLTPWKFFSVGATDPNIKDSDYKVACEKVTEAIKASEFIKGGRLIEIGEGTRFEVTRVFVTNNANAD